jgi:hypothetical protein
MNRLQERVDGIYEMIFAKFGPVQENNCSMVLPISDLETLKKEDEQLRRDSKFFSEMVRILLNI